MPSGHHYCLPSVPQTSCSSYAQNAFTPPQHPPKPPPIIALTPKVQNLLSTPSLQKVPVRHG
jgi:hypothetical protein